MSEYFQKIFKSPINTSISKNLYSIPKSTRFDPPLESPCKRSFYNVRKNSGQPRSTTFGLGKKWSLIKNECAPPPGVYESTQFFLKNKENKKGFSFGSDRRNSFFDCELQNPGPGKYNPSIKKQSHPSFTMRIKIPDTLQKHQNKLGPGEYEPIPQLTATGNYFNSKNRNFGCSKIGKTARFDDDRTITPGPGKYDDRLNINPLGAYFNSKLNSKNVKNYMGTPRSSINEPSQTPGPGTYYIFQTFAKRNYSTAR